LFGEQRNAAQYLNHPYGTPVIGWRHEMMNLTREDALDWYRQNYAPNNAVLVVAGDVTPDEVRALAETYYGPLVPSENLPERARVQEPPQLAERRLIFEDPRVAQPYVTRGYLAPERDPGDQAKAAALTVLAEILGGNPATSVLGRKLVFGTGAAIYASAFYDGMSIDDTVFSLAVMPAADVSLPEVEAALDTALAEFLRDGVDPEQFERIKTQVRAADIYARDNTQGLARRYGEALASGFSVEDVQGWPEALDAVTEEDVMAAAREVFDRKRAVTGYLTRPAQEEVSQ
jgi:zinc protease